MLEKLKDITAQWRKFGTHMKISQNDLDGIDKDAWTPYDCFDLLMREWIDQKGSEATTSELERACRSINDNTLADAIKKDTKDKTIHL